MTDTGSRSHAITRALDYFDSGGFEAELARRVAIRTESQKPGSLPELHRYLNAEMGPAFAAMGFACRVYDNPVAGGGPVLLAMRMEDSDLPTMLGYGHGDVIRGLEDGWTKGRGPWRLTGDGDRLYGRGTADNKAQHTINMAALRAVIETRGRLGFNAKFLIEMSEETGSRGLKAVIEANRDDFAADVFIGSDGPRLSPDRPTVTLGCRGAKNFDLVCDLREGGHHSGNWGGLLADPGVILAHAIVAIVDARGRILIPDWLPPPAGPAVKAALDDLVIAPDGDGPAIDPDWGEPGLSAAEKLYGWNSFAVLTFRCGTPERPVNAIAPRARAHCQLRFVAGTDREGILPALRRHLDAAGFARVQIAPPPPENAGDFAASRTEPDHSWVRVVRDSLARTTGAPPAVVPSMGGSICNDLFTDLLGLPAIWLPHSHPACAQHAPDEHVLRPLCREALGLMAGLYWDLGAGCGPKTV